MYSDSTLFILAGGKASRMRGLDKAWVKFQGKPFINWTLENLGNVASNIVISANKNKERYKGLDVLSDIYPEYVGPLAGLDALSKDIRCKQWVFVVPCDSPILRREVLDLLWSYHQNYPNAKAFVPTLDGKMQSVVMLLEKSILATVRSFLDRGERKIGLWLKEQGVIEIEVADTLGSEMFLNINSELELEKLMESKKFF